MFDKIFYINLKHRIDRDDNVREQLTKINALEISQRIDAIYGRTLDIPNLPSSLITLKGKRDAMAVPQKLYTFLNKGAIGCALSHRQVYQEIVQQRIRAALILEDDITIVNDFFNKIATLAKNVPKETDILFLGYHSTSSFDKNYKNRYLQKPKTLFGLFGYVVTFEGAQKLLKHVFPITYQIDSEIPFHFDKIKAYATTPAYTLIYSDQSSTKTKFGTDIQLEKFTASPANNGFAAYMVAIFLGLLLLCAVIL